jgi:hypothetical protein
MEEIGAKTPSIRNFIKKVANMAPGEDKYADI